MSRNTLTVFYGPKQITDDEILDTIAQAIDQHKNYTVSNGSMGGDTAPGTYKYAAAYYSLAPTGSPLRGRTAGEGQFLNFGTDIQTILYGGTLISNPNVYNSAYNAFISNTPFPVNNESMGGDPRVGTVKTGDTFYYKNEQITVEEDVREGGSFVWDAHN
jgi:hypothetical protein